MSVRSLLSPDATGYFQLNFAREAQPPPPTDKLYQIFQVNLDSQLNQLSLPQAFLNNDYSLTVNKVGGFYTGRVVGLTNGGSTQNIAVIVQNIADRGLATITAIGNSV